MPARRSSLDNPYDNAAERTTGPTWALRTLAGAVVVTGAAVGLSGTAAADVDDPGPTSFDSFAASSADTFADSSDSTSDSGMTDVDTPAFDSGRTDLDLSSPASSADLSVDLPEIGELSVDPTTDVGKWPASSPGADLRADLAADRPDGHGAASSRASALPDDSRLDIEPSSSVPAPRSSAVATTPLGTSDPEPLSPVAAMSIPEPVFSSPPPGRDAKRVEPEPLFPLPATAPAGKNVGTVEDTTAARDPGSDPVTTGPVTTGPVTTAAVVGDPEPSTSPQAERPVHRNAPLPDGSQGIVMDVQNLTGTGDPNDTVGSLTTVLDPRSGARYSSVRATRAHGPGNTETAFIPQLSGERVAYDPAGDTVAVYRLGEGDTGRITERTPVERVRVQAVPGAVSRHEAAGVLEGRPGAPRQAPFPYTPPTAQGASVPETSRAGTAEVEQPLTTPADQVATGTDGVPTDGPLDGARPGDVGDRPDDESAAPGSAASGGPAEPGGRTTAGGGLVVSPRGVLAATGVGLAGRWLVDSATQAAKRAPEVTVSKIAKGSAAAGLGMTLTPRQERAMSALNRRPVETLRNLDEFGATMGDVGRRVVREAGSEVGYGLLSSLLTAGAGPLGPVGQIPAAGAAKLVQKERIDPFLERVLSDEKASDVLAGPDGTPYRRGGGRADLVDPLGERITSSPIDDMLTTVDGRPLTTRGSLLVASDGRPLTAPNLVERLGRRTSALTGSSAVRGLEGQSLSSAPILVGSDGSPLVPRAEGSVLRPETIVRDDAIEGLLSGTARQERAVRAEFGLPEAGDLTTTTPRDVGPLAVERAAVEATLDSAATRRVVDDVLSAPEWLSTTPFIHTEGIAPTQRGPSLLSRASALGEAAKFGTRAGLTTLGVPAHAADAAGALLDACLGAACTSVGRAVEGLVTGTTPTGSALSAAATADATGQLARAAATLAPDELVHLAAVTGSGYLLRSGASASLTGGTGRSTTRASAVVPTPVALQPNGTGTVGADVAPDALTLERPWPQVGGVDDPSAVLRSSTRLEQIAPSPARSGLMDHLRGDGAEALGVLRGSEYRIDGDPAWYRAVGDTSEQLRQLGNGTPPLSQERVRQLFPTMAPEELAALDPMARGMVSAYDKSNATSQRLLRDGGPAGYTAPETACWLVCDADGRARVLDPIAVGTDASVTGAPLTPDTVGNATRIDYIHTHPFAGYETAGLSTSDLAAAQVLREQLQAMGSNAELGMTSIDALTGTVTRGVPDPASGGWKRLQVLPGGGGRVTDQLNMDQAGLLSTLSPDVERPLPLDVAPAGTSDAMSRGVTARIQPSPRELNVQRLRAEQLADFDARLATGGRANDPATTTRATTTPTAPTVDVAGRMDVPSGDVIGGVHVTGGTDLLSGTGAGGTTLTRDVAEQVVSTRHAGGRPGVGVGAIVASVAAPFAEEGLRQVGVLPTDPLQQGWWPQTVNVVARAGTGCLTGLTSRAECATSAVAEGSNAFFDQTTAGRQARQFAETEYDGDPVRERVEAAASVPINTLRQVGTFSKTAGSAIATTGQLLGSGLAYGWDVVNGGSQMPLEDYARNFNEMSGPEETRANLTDLWDNRQRIDRRTFQVLTGVPDRTTGTPGAASGVVPATRAAPPDCGGGVQRDCVEPGSRDPGNPNSVGRLVVGSAAPSEQQAGAQQASAQQAGARGPGGHPVCSPAITANCVSPGSWDPTNPNSVGSLVVAPKIVGAGVPGHPDYDRLVAEGRAGDQSTPGSTGYGAGAGQRFVGDGSGSAPDRAATTLANLASGYTINQAVSDGVHRIQDAVQQIGSTWTAAQGAGAASPASAPPAQVQQATAPEPEPTLQERAGQVGQAVWNIITAPHPLDPVRGALGNVLRSIPGFPGS